MFLFYGDESGYSGEQFGTEQAMLVVAGILLNTHGASKTRREFAELLAELSELAGTELTELKGQVLFRGSGARCASSVCGGGPIAFICSHRERKPASALGLRRFGRLACQPHMGVPMRGLRSPGGGRARSGVARLQQLSTPEGAWCAHWCAKRAAVLARCIAEGVC
jgi:hypothetical protein